MKRRSGSYGREVEEASKACSIAATFPALVSFVTDQAFDDGEAREPGTIMIFTEDGRWKAWLHDRDGCCGAFLSNTTLSNLLSAVDRALEQDELEWRPDRPPGGRRGQTGK